MANQTGIANVTREVVVADRPALDLVASVGGGVLREILTGDRFGMSVFGDIQSVEREILTGDRLGRAIFADTISVVREVLIAEPPFRAINVIREVLMSRDNENLSQQRLIAGYKQTVVMVRPKMALPSTVKSAHFIATLREMVVRHVDRIAPRSPMFTSTLRQQSVLHRPVLGAQNVRSFITIGILREQVIRSRGQTYTPVSGVYTKAQRQQVVSLRTVTKPVGVRSGIFARALAQQFIASRALKVITITTTVDVGSTYEQIAQSNKRPAPHSPTDARFLTSMVVQKHNVVPPGIDDRVAQMLEQITMRRARTPVIGVEFAMTLAEKVVQRRVTSILKSQINVGRENQMVVQHRNTYGPAFIIGRHAATLRNLVVQHRATVKWHSTTVVGTLQVTYTLRRVTPRPIDVIDPTIGRHAATLRNLVVQHRVTTPPATISKESRYVYNVAGQVVIHDTFPAPDMPPAVIPETDVYQVGEMFAVGDYSWGPVSAVTAQQIASMVAVGDNTGWIDPLMPNSITWTFGVTESAVLGDAGFPAPSTVIGDTLVGMIGEAVALGDTFPGSMVPQSVVQVRNVIEMAAVGDAQLPNPMIPLSEVRSSSVASILAVRDPSLSGRFDMSEIEMLSVLEFAVIRDPTLVGITRRKGPRPVVSVSMS